MYNFALPLDILNKLKGTLPPANLTLSNTIIAYFSTHITQTERKSLLNMKRKLTLSNKKIEILFLRKQYINHIKRAHLNITLIRMHSNITVTRIHLSALVRIYSNIHNIQFYKY